MSHITPQQQKHHIHLHHHHHPSSQSSHIPSTSSIPSHISQPTTSPISTSSFHPHTKRNLTTAAPPLRQQQSFDLVRMTPPTSSPSQPTSHLLPSSTSSSPITGPHQRHPLVDHLSTPSSTLPRPSMDRFDRQSSLYRPKRDNRDRSEDEPEILDDMSIFENIPEPPPSFREETPAAMTGEKRKGRANADLSDNKESSV